MTDDPYALRVVYDTAVVLAYRRHVDTCDMPIWPSQLCIRPGTHAGGCLPAPRDYAPVEIK